MRSEVPCGVGVAILTIWPLALIVRRFGLTPAQAVVVGAIVMSIPSRTVQSDYTMSEKPLFLVIALTHKFMLSISASSSSPPPASSSS